MKMKLVDACLSLCLTRLIFSSIFESAHPSRVLAEASRLGELCAWSRRNARQRLKVRAGGTPNTVWISSGFEIRGRLAFAPASWSAAVLSFHYPQIESRAWKPERLILFVILSLRRISRQASRRYVTIHRSRS